MVYIHHNILMRLTPLIIFLGHISTIRLDFIYMIRYGIINILNIGIRGGGVLGAGKGLYLHIL